MSRLRLFLGVFTVISCFLFLDLPKNALALTGRNYSNVTLRADGGASVNSFEEGTVNELWVFGTFWQQMADPRCKNPVNLTVARAVIPNSIESMRYDLIRDGSFIGTGRDLTRGGDWGLQSEGVRVNCGAPASEAYNAAPNYYRFNETSFKIPVLNLSAGTYYIRFSGNICVWPEGGGDFANEPDYPSYCSEISYDDQPLSFTITAPPPPATINVESNIDSSWTVNGPSTFNGEGRSGSYSGPAGEYSISPATLGCYSNSVNESPQSVDPGGTITFVITYTSTCTNPTVDLKLDGEDGPANRAYGASGTLTWTTTNAATCTASNAWFGSRNAGGGSEGTGSMTTDRTYTITCSSASGAQASDSVVVDIAGAPTPSASITANNNDGSTTIPYNTAATIRWSSENVTSCSISPPNWTGLSETTGRSTGNLTGTVEYSISCSGDYGTATDSVNIIVGPNVDIKADGSDGPITVAYNATVALTWSSVNATSCTASNGWSGSKPVNGNETSGSLTTATSYTITCTGPGGSDDDTVTVNVGIAPPSAPTVSAPSCSSTPYTITANWSGSPNPSYGWYVWVSDNPGANRWWYKIVPSGTTTTAPDGFSPYSGGVGALAFSPGTTYWISVSNGVESPRTQFSVPTCPPSAPVVTVSSCSAGTYNVDISWTGAPNPSYGYYVWISDNPSAGRWWYKIVASGTTTTAPTGFTPQDDEGNLVLYTGTTYYASVSNGVESPRTQFSSLGCQPSAPTVSAPSCSSTPYTITANWSGSPNPSYGWYVWVSDNPGANRWWYKIVPSGTTTTAPDGFSPYSGGVGALAFSPGTTYWISVSNGVESPRTQFSVPTCPPPVASDVTATQPNYCVSGPTVTVGWTFSNPGGGNQSAYQVQVDDQGSFANPEIDTGKIISNSNAYTAGQGILQFNTTYRARVRVWNAQDTPSDWTTSNSFKTPIYAYPQVYFTYSPVSPQLNSPVQFTDGTTFYGPPNGRRWTWNFGDGTNSSQQNPSKTYSSENNYYVTLTAEDNAGQSCSLTRGPIIVQKPIPKWKEVAPR